jgi:hypothetical protein
MMSDIIACSTLQHINSMFGFNSGATRIDSRCVELILTYMVSQN